MDVYCAKCGEPWNSYGDMKPMEAVRFRNGEGCPCCGFGTTCTVCDGTGQETSYGSDCEICRGSRYIVVRRQGTKVKVHSGYDPNVREHDWKDIEPLIMRKAETVHALDGVYQQYIVRCPRCSKDPTIPACTECCGSGVFTASKEEEEDRLEKHLYTKMEGFDDAY